MITTSGPGHIENTFTQGIMEISDFILYFRYKIPTANMMKYPIFSSLFCSRSPLSFAGGKVAVAMLVVINVLH